MTAPRLVVIEGGGAPPPPSPAFTPAPDPLTGWRLALGLTIGLGGSALLLAAAVLAVPAVALIWLADRIVAPPATPSQEIRR